ncbi:MAG TPA: polyprenyl synthetase family protein [Candidatus Saccharimonadales bacterium]|nr:polyprenyl synthetase family protein [Candidatus Saccharimonadales bacterium]
MADETGLMGFEFMREKQAAPQATPELGLSLPEYMAGVQERVGRRIADYLAALPSDIRTELSHSLISKKANRIRPALTYMTGDTFGIPRTELDDLALATELVHTASLIFDDLPAQDDSDIRRGKEALHKKFGEGLAQNDGIALLADAGNILGGAESHREISGQLSRSIWSRLGSRGMAQGQRLDLKTFGREPNEVTEKELDRITDLKTGQAIAMSIVGSAIIGELPDEIIDILKEYSYHAGIAYQVKDDLRDITATTEELGKPAGQDVKNQRPTYYEVLGEQGCKDKIALHVAAALVALDRLPNDYNPIKFREIIEYFAAK